MAEQISKQDADEASLILKTIRDFVAGAGYLDTKDMTALFGAFIESAVYTLEENTDPDTALMVISQILLRLAPRCSNGSVTVFHDSHNPMGTKQ